MSNDSVAAATSVLVVVSLVWIVIGIGLLVWYLWAMARLFPRIGLRAGEGWIPIWNQWKLLDRAGLPGWLVLFTFIGLGIIPFIMQIIAMHRLGREYGASAGYTVIGVILPPLWATLFASYIGTGHASHHAGASAAPAYPQHVPASGASAGYAGSYAPVPASAPPAAPVPPPPPTYTEPGHTAVPELPPESMPEPWPSAVWANVPAQDTPLGAETEAEYDRLAAESFQAPPAVPLGQQAPPSPFSWTAASQSNPEPAPAEPEPVIPPVHPFAVNQAADQPSTPPVAPQVASQPPAAPPVAQPPAAPQPPAAQQPVPPPAQPVQLPPTPASAASAARPTGITGVYERLPEADSARAAHAEEPAQLDLDRTIVVPRRPAVTWSLELPDGSRLPLDDDTIVGRRPVEFDGAAVVAIPDPTRTLSKSHARLTRDGDQWFVEDLGSTNGLVLINDDGSESEIPAGVRVAATERMLFGTLEVRLRSGGDAA